jgi:hypothetical protein
LIITPREVQTVCMAPDDDGKLILKKWDGDPSSFYWIIFQLTGGGLTPNGQPMTEPPASSLESDCQFLLVHEKTRKWQETLARYTQARLSDNTLDSVTIENPPRPVYKIGSPTIFEHQSPWWKIHPTGKATWGWDCLDCANGKYDVGTSVLSWPCNDGANQQWRFNFTTWP